MNKAVFLLLALSANGFAGDVGASDPQKLKSASKIAALTAVDQSASERWAIQPTQDQANERETKEFEMRFERIDAKVDMELDALISKKLDQLLAE